MQFVWKNNECDSFSLWLANSFVGRREWSGLKRFIGRIATYQHVRVEHEAWWVLQRRVNISKSFVGNRSSLIPSINQAWNDRVSKVLLGLLLPQGLWEWWHPLVGCKAPEHSSWWSCSAKPPVQEGKWCHLLVDWASKQILVHQPRKPTATTFVISTHSAIYNRSFYLLMPCKPSFKKLQTLLFLLSLHHWRCTH